MTPGLIDTSKDLVQFLKRPRLPEEDDVVDAPLQVFLQLLMLSLLLSFGVLMLMGVLRDAGLVPELPHAMEDIMKQFPFLVVFLLAAVLMPALEELTFRLWLLYRPIYFHVSLWLIAFFLSTALTQAGFPLLGYGVFGVAALITILLLTFKDAAQQLLVSLYTNYYSLLFYGAAVIFALVHLINFQVSGRILLLAPLLVLPQLLLGLILGYTRVRLGLIWAIALHGVYNALVLSMAYTGMQMETTSP
ncbi:type II CAAX prenyl endopeptidase Rce1 family protein [Cesiribacter sp. SM1]|uniref:CPBP family glutamic-type intramembrane protease n=1 Tax=Cesiribacter sp. SM1 TaxID=2861196 RepID=UPI001CD2D453|nr:CPBP family glutamic-type intramembrane protease [Cesiribacter sp. SM1]